MTLVELVQTIGDVLTNLDTMLSDPGLASTEPTWQTLYAMRIHLDNQQRRLVSLSLQIDDAKFAALTTQILDANDSLGKEIGALNRINNVIGAVAKIASVVDQILALA